MTSIKTISMQTNVWLFLRLLVSISQHWLKKCLHDTGQQAISLTNVDQYLCRHWDTMSSCLQIQLCFSVLSHISKYGDWFYVVVYLVIHYNIFGMAVSIVISTIHEKACTDVHSAQKFEKQNWVIHRSCNHNEKIGKLWLIWIFLITFIIHCNYSASYFSHNWPEFTFEVELIPLNITNA